MQFNVMLWKQSLQNVYCVFGLDGHVSIVPASIFVLSILKRGAQGGLDCFFILEDLLLVCTMDFNRTPLVSMLHHFPLVVDSIQGLRIYLGVASESNGRPDEG